MRKQIFAMLVLVVAVSSAGWGRESYNSSGYYYRYQFLGFSEDGKYLSYRETYVSEASEGNNTKTYYVDVEKNAYVKKPQAKFGNMGEQVVSNPLPEFGNPHQVRFKLAPYESSYHDDLQLDLTEVPFKTKDCEYYGDTKMLKLVLTNRVNGQAQVFQEDKYLPKARGCPDAYRIESVYVLNEEVMAVFLNKFIACTEGPCVGHMVVTAKPTSPGAWKP